MVTELLLLLLLLVPLHPQPRQGARGGFVPEQLLEEVGDGWERD